MYKPAIGIVAACMIGACTHSGRDAPEAAREPVAPGPVPDAAPDAERARDAEQARIEAETLAPIQTKIDELYAVISGPAGERDWDRFEAMFAEGAVLSQVFHREDGTGGLMRLTPAEFAERSGEYLLTNPFYETEIASRIDLYAGLAHVWSTYESRRDPAEPPFTRGINSIQLIKPPGGDWKILALTWDSEASGIPIPDRYTGD